MIERFAAVALVVALANLFPAFTHAQQLAAAPGDRNAVRRYLLMLDGAAAAYPLSVAGGNGVGEVVSEPPIRRPGDGTRVTPQLTKAKVAGAANFRFRIDGLDAPLQRAVRVDAPEVSQDLARDSVGVIREPSLTGGPLRLGNLTFVVSEVSAAPLYDWFEDFVVKGNNSAANERGGALEFLAPNLKDVVLSVGLRGLGIVRVTQSTPVSGDQIGLVKVELYCEEMELL